jgi:hypothetical protein
MSSPRASAVHRHFLRLRPLTRGSRRLPTGAVVLVNPAHIVRVTAVAGRPAGVVLVTGERLLVDPHEFKEQLEIYDAYRKGSLCD